MSSRHGAGQTQASRSPHSEGTAQTITSCGPITSNPHLHCSKCLVARPNARDFAERNVMDSRPVETASLRLDIGRPDHLAPRRGFGAEELAKVGRLTGE